uniref:Beta-1,4-N-acetylgalactosaminyltransferase n=1 Tax=Scleropages formosus TaxID=113540 RepID=A0A8C9WJG4_SCLFO
MLRLPVKKIRKQFRLLLLLVLLTFAVWFTYLHINQGKAIKVHISYGKGKKCPNPVLEASFSFLTQYRCTGDQEVPKPEGEQVAMETRGKMPVKYCAQGGFSSLYKGQANLHVFEDWCGSSVAQLRKNLHFPLYPHLRTAVKKLAVAPRWKNYGLRIFGFIHPYRDGDFQFAVSSDDNSEFWLSSDESPLNARLLAYVGRLGSEWTAPGEFSKFRSQSSKPVHLIYSRRYYFEVLHKQDDKGSDHVEVGWRPFLPGLKYEVIDSSYISLYTDESGLKMNGVGHIPQTLASHSRTPREVWPISRHGADMLRPDPRDTFFSIPMIEPSRLDNLLPPCAYSPSYVVKDFPIARYQGLQFVYLSFVYPNDFTRLTHMERENKCFYRESPIYLEKVKLPSEGPSQPWSQHQEDGNTLQQPNTVRGRTLSWAHTGPEEPSRKESPEEPPKPNKSQALGNSSRADRRPVAASRKPRASNARFGTRSKEDKVYVTRPRASGSRRNVVFQHPKEVFPGVFLYHNGKTTKLINLRTRPKRNRGLSRGPNLLPKSSLRETRASLLGGTFTQTAGHKASARVALTHHQQSRKEESQSKGEKKPEPDPDEGPEEGGLSDYSYEEADPRPGWAEEAINWQRTFSVNTMDFELLRSDWNDLRCNVSGNLQLAESEVVDVLAQYMEKLNEHNGGIYTLLRIINVEKRRDSARGNRYLIELELMERGKRVVRLSEYIYLLQHPGQMEDSLENGSTPYAKPLLCQPTTLKWRHSVMVHFVVPVKNQARWVQQFISDMELLHLETKDDNFSIIIVDFQSDDMDVEQALKDSTVPRYEYLRREGNFERSAGLQIGVDSIKDSHSIVFLCDLHIHFPLNILESIRKHCVEGSLAFAPIVMRLGCGSSPQEPDGYWEVNGFGLFGIYKSDFDKVGGMNTEEFKDRWGGEDWELLDRVLQNGLEVERLRMRNFFHYYHSKRGMWNAQMKKGPKG